MSEKARMRAIVRGGVQGVFFRDFAQRHASSLGLTGYVRNCWDGTVEVVAEGEKEGLERLLRQLHIGPSSARVERVDVKWGEPAGDFSSFEVRYS